MAHRSKYKKLKDLGVGGFGTVTLVEVRETGEKAVIKQIWTPTFQAAGKAKDTAKQEIELLKAVCHPNIVAYRDSFQAGSLMCIEMEYCDRGDLHDFIQKQSGQLLREGEIFDIFVQLCDAIQYIHHKRILHRDIKPQNIFLTTEHHVKLGDFGISKTLYRTTQVALSHAGTPLYSSPEVLQYRPYNNKSDIWSAGVVLYELTMLKHPFIDPSKGVEEALQKIIHGSYNQVDFSFTKDHRLMIETMLEKQSSDRPSIDKLLHMPPLKNRVHLQSLRSQDNTDNTNEEKEYVFDSEGRQTILHKPASTKIEKRHDSGIVVGEKTIEAVEFFQDESVPVDEFKPGAMPPSQMFLFGETGLESAEKSLATGHLVISIPLMVFLGYQMFLVLLVNYFLE